MMNGDPKSLPATGESIRGPRRRLLKGFVAGMGCAALGTSAMEPAKNVPLPPPIRDQDYRLVRDWDFATVITDPQRLRDEFYTRYIYDEGRLDALNDEWQRYRDNDNHVFEQGMLALVARAPGSVGSGRIESGMLRSKWSGRHGYFECRMKVPGARGMWPAFWLNPQDGLWPPEIDVVEIVNNGRDSTRDSFHFVHSAIPDERPALRSLLRSNQAYRPGFDYQHDFHDFAVEWTPNRIRHWVDDVLVVEREFRWQHADGLDGGAAHVLVNLAVGGKWPGPPSGSDAFPAKLQLKHIRVWQL